MSVRRVSLWTALLALLLLLGGVAAAVATSTTFVVTRGASMQPSFSSGDLAVLRPADAYRVGDVAGYRNQALNRVVVHRIAAVDGDVITFKGDANSFLDPERVERNDVVGALAVRVPKLGAVLLWLTSPLNILLLTIATGLGINRIHQPRVAVPTPRRELDNERIVPVEDMNFPHELAVADVPDVAALLELAEHYDRPVLHEREHGLLFVVEGAMLFRCSVPTPAAPVVSGATDDPAPWQRSDGRRPSPRGAGWDYEGRSG